jgi:hypothetical protein
MEERRPGKLLDQVWPSRKNVATSGFYEGLGAAQQAGVS